MVKFWMIIVMWLPLRELSALRLRYYRLIFNDIYIDNPIIVSDIELNSYLIDCFESYQFS